jgi:hypothetical protein
MRRWLAGCGVVVGVVASCIAVAGPAFGAAQIERFTVRARLDPILSMTPARAQAWLAC